MKLLKIVLVVTSLFLLNRENIAANNTDNLTLMPVPREVQLASGKHKLTPAFTINIEGKATRKICDASSRMLRRISAKTGFFFTQDYIKPDMKQANASLVVIVKRPGDTKLREDESYKLEVNSANIVLKSETDIGALRGLETLYQLLSKDTSGYYFPALKIEDSPRFVWRGLMIDASRHFMPVDVLKRNLDAMATVKLNVFHWHLSDDQGFRVETKSLPSLIELASDGLFYTQEEIKAIIKYADDRGIMVIPEFDIPGHSTSWLTAYPELASSPGPYQIERKWGVFDPTFDPTNEKTYEFFDAFFKEMSLLFSSEYMHIGGDENNGKQWDGNAKIQEFMKKNNIPDNHTLQAYFNKRILAILTKYNKKMIGWDEILHPEMPKNIIIQSWRGLKSLDEASAKGYQVLLSNGYYIDLCYPASNHYLNDPIPSTLNLTDEQRKLILGGEATMWAEIINSETIDSRIWPRTAAIAERLWSRADVNDIDDMYRRLNSITLLLEDIGAAHLKNRDMLIRRILGSNDASSFKTFLGAIEPLKEYARHVQRKDYTSYAPLARVADIAVPDAEDARLFNKDAAEFIRGDKSRVKNIISYLSKWKDNHAEFKKLIENNEILKEIEPLSVSLSEVSEVGLEAMDLFLKNLKPEAKWLENAMEKIKTARRQDGQVELVIVNAIENLVKLSGNNLEKK